MTDQKFDPVKEFVALRDSLSRKVEQGIKSVTGAAAYPPVDIYETDDAVVVRTAFLDGLKAQNLEVSMEEDALVISGVTQDSLEAAENRFLLRELRFGPFSRTIRIPRKVKANQASASFKNGVLTITLPKAENSGAQIIGVTPAE